MSEPGLPYVEHIDDSLPFEVRPDLDEARRWIARRYTVPIADVEREFGFKPGTLRKYAEDER